MKMQNYAYRPKAQGISYMEVQRDPGFNAKTFHMHDHHEIALITTSCACRATSNGNSVTIQTPALVLTRAGSFHEIAEVYDGLFLSRVIFFHPHMLKGIPGNLHHVDKLFGSDLLILPLNQTQLEEYLPLFDLLKARQYPETLLLLLAIFSHMIQMIEGGNTPVVTNAQQSFVFDIIEMIQNHPEVKYSIADLAEQFHVSQTKLKSDFKKIAGMPINTFCRQARLQKAMVMLESTQESQSQIAYACGFSDESYFIDAFHKNYGMTPRAYRQQLKSTH